MESWHDPVPEQAPVQPAKVEPVFATAVSCTGVPMLKPAVQVVPQLIPVGLLVTVPIPVPVSVTVRVAPVRSKTAVTDSTEFISTWHDPVPEQAPVQPAKVEPVFATAVSCTGVPMLKPAVQVVPQLIPVGLLVTVPIPVPVSGAVRFARVG